MKNRQKRNTVKAILPVALIAFALGCGYSKNTMPAAMPAIVQLNPASANAGASVQLEVDGTNFASKAVINFNGAPMTTTFMNSGKLQTTVPASAVMNSGMVPVTVTNPATSNGGYGGTPAETSLPKSFTIN